MFIEKVFYKKFFKNLFSDPFQINFSDGDAEHYGEGEPKFKIIFNEPISKADIIKNPSIALGEGYMTKKIDIEGNVQEVIESLYNNKKSFLKNSAKYTKLLKKVSNNIQNSKDNIEFHYDIGNDFYKLWLDDNMNYSCGYFETATDTLNKAQHNKIKHILNKLNFKKGQTLLDIGCGWGDLIISAAKQYKVKALGITISSEQFQKVNERIKTEGLEDLVEVQQLDYRKLKNRKFDRIVSVGMLEHIGKENLSEYFSKVNDLLNEKGISLLHCITGIDAGGTNTWIDKYIFPGGYIPAIKELITCIASQKYQLLDVEGIGRHYGRTLEYWARNFENALPEIQKSKDETFIRMWRLYLNSCAASFNCGNISIHQILFSKGMNEELPWTREYIYI